MCFSWVRYWLGRSKFLVLENTLNFGEGMFFIEEKKCAGAMGGRAHLK